MPDSYLAKPERTRLLVVSQGREPFDQALAANRNRLSLKHLSTPLAAFSLALSRPGPPTVLFLDDALIFAQEVGALRLFAEAVTDSHVVIIETEGEGSPGDLKGRLSGEEVRFHPRPQEGEEVLALVEEAVGPLHPWREMSEPIFDLVQGVADAVNNPLASLSGFLQVLAAQVQGGQEADRIFAEIDRALAQLTQVARDLEIAGGRNRIREESFELGARLAAIAAESGELPPVHYRAPGQELPFTGDRELFDRAVRSLVLLARQVSAEGVTIQLHSARQEKNILVEVVVPALIPSRWRADRTFHPFFLSRALQIPRIGLAPAVAAGATRNLGGRVEAHWDPEGALRLALVLA